MSNTCQPYRTAVFALGTVALLSFTSYIANGAATFLPMAPVSSPIALFTGNLLSPVQKAQLAQLGIPIALPTYLPAGFRLTDFSAKKEQHDYVCCEYSWYSIFYQGANHACLEVSANLDPAMALSTSHLQKTSVKTRLGEVEVYSGNVEGKPMIVGLLFLPSQNRHKNGYMLRTGAWMPRTNPGRRCNPVSREEYIQVLKSLEMLK